ncbi:MAG: hypothetical protein P1R58_06295 [bacterium]|nr:hypothetical protein [bacterium]
MKMKLLLVMVLVLLFTISALAGPPPSVAAIPIGDDHPWGGDEQVAITAAETDDHSWGGDQLFSLAFWLSLLTAV